MRRASSALLALAFVLGGCGHGGSAAIAKSDLPNLVLLERDVGKRFSQFDEGRQVAADAHPGPRADRARFGRIDGWKSRWRAVGTPTNGVAVVESRADLFDSEDGARKDLQAYRDELSAPPPGSGATERLLQEPKLGEDAVAVELRQGPAVYLTVAWRDANATGSILVQGRRGETTVDDAVALARKPAARMNAAAG